MARPTALAAILLVLLAAACAAPGPYPSLAPRLAETVYASEDERQPVPQPDDPALAREIDRLDAEARSGAAEFDSAFRPAEAAAAAAGASGSDSWVEAQQALSRVEAARAKTTAALADLDRLGIERSSAGTLGEGDRERLRRATEEIQALADSQLDRLRRLGERLSGL